jgi:hypothetical protein
LEAVDELWIADHEAADRWGMMGKGGDVVQKCTTLVPKNTGMVSFGAYLHHIRRNLVNSVQM